MKFVLSIILVLVSSAGASAQGLTYNSQIHNAPGWLHSHTYTYNVGPPTNHKTRVNNGAAWNETTYTPGLLLNSYELLDPGGGQGSTCASAASGGPSGTTSNITDGTCHWKYLSVVDYITFTGYAFDSGIYWNNGDIYGQRDVVVASNALSYMEMAAGCQSTISPTGTAAEMDTADGCIWSYLAAVTYSSKSHPSPLERFWNDSFYGYIQAATFTATGSIDGYTMTITGVGSGAVMQGSTITGSGISPGEFIVKQITGTGGAGCPDVTCTRGVGTYQVAYPFSVAPGTAISGSYGALTVTTPPATHAFDITLPDLLSSKDMLRVNVGITVNLFTITGGGGSQITDGSGASWAVNISQSLHGPGGVTDPVLMFHGRTNDVNFLVNDFYHPQLWNDAEYVGGQNGEYNPLTFIDHNYAWGDSIGPAGWHKLPAAASYIPDGYGFPNFIEAAPGEGFGDTLLANPSTPLSGYDANLGVALRGVGVAGLAVGDSNLIIQRLQVSSDTQPAIYSGFRAQNQSRFVANLLQSGVGSDMVTNAGFNGDWVDNLIIAQGKLGVGADYGGTFINNTFVCPSGTCGSAMSIAIDWVNMYGLVTSGNAVFGFLHFTSSNFYGDAYNPMACGCVTVMGTNNVTDVASTDGADFPATTFPGGGVNTEYALPFQTGSNYADSRYPGTPGVPQFVPICGSFVGSSDGFPVAGTCGITNSVAPSAAFVSWPSNLRPKPAGPLIGAGAFFAPYLSYAPVPSVLGAANGMCNGDINLWVPCGIYPSTPDLLGATRPTSGRYDAGAVQYGGAGPIITSPGRFIFR